RAFHVTGVQTCALPICRQQLLHLADPGQRRRGGARLQRALGRRHHRDAAAAHRMGGEVRQLRRQVRRALDGELRGERPLRIILTAAVPAYSVRSSHGPPFVFETAAPCERSTWASANIGGMRSRTSSTAIVGIISDTHGLLRPEAAAALRGSAPTVHAADTGGPAVLDGLDAIAPGTATRGPLHHGANDLPDTAMLEMGGRWLYVIHDVNALDLDPRAAGIDVVIAGHSHKPGVHEKDGVLYVNPGSAGPRRFT